MYEANLDTSSLRQGDVIRGLYLPRYAISDVELVHRLDKNGDLDFAKRAILKTEQRYAVVLSQCCEFNQGKRNAFSLGVLLNVREMLRPRISIWGFNLAELIPLAKSSLRQHAIDELRQANVIDLRSGQNKAVNAYLFDPAGEHLQEPHILDFTQVTSIRMEDVKAVLRSKILQLDDQHRREFQKKLAYFYGRPAN